MSSPKRSSNRAASRSPSPARSPQKRQRVPSPSSSSQLASLASSTDTPFRHIKVKRLSDKAIVPTRGSSGAAGYDLYAAEKSIIPKRGKGLVKTDIAMKIASHLYGRVAPRSGLAWKHSIDVGAGVIDSDYRGNIGVILFNHGDDDFNIQEGDRIAQIIFEKIETPDLLVVDNLDDTERGEGGFGSTGVAIQIAPSEKPQ